MGKRPSNYTTKQGEAVLALLQSRANSHLTVAQIETCFAENGVSVGRTTLYRQLDRLIREGRVKKYIVDENAACYQYTDETVCADIHYHLKCGKCGKLIHMDGKTLPDIARGIRDVYDFEIDVNRTVFYGACRTCSGESGI